jgi:hypothetical protein
MFTLAGVKRQKEVELELKAVRAIYIALTGGAAVSNLFSPKWLIMVRRLNAHPKTPPPRCGFEAKFWLTPEVGCTVAAAAAV